VELTQLGIVEYYYCNFITEFGNGSNKSYSPYSIDVLIKACTAAGPDEINGNVN
jgi:hypothetical protein